MRPDIMLGWFARRLGAWLRTVSDRDSEASLQVDLDAFSGLATRCGSSP
jgi:hypothetical protein